jgi:hypothetical protein
LAAQPDALAAGRDVLVGARAVQQDEPGQPDALAAAWAGLWFRAGELCGWAAAVLPVPLAEPEDGLRVAQARAGRALPVRSDVLAAYDLAAHDLAPRLDVRAHWALQQVHLAARHVSHQV